MSTANILSDMKTATWFARAFMSLCVFAFAAMLALPVQAHAKTLAELDDEVVARQLDVDIAQQRYFERQQALNASATVLYKYASPSALLSSLTASDIIGVIQNLDYLHRLNTRFEEATEASLSSARELEMAKQELQAIRDERASRAKQGAEAEAEHYAQGSGEWSTLPYWGGQVSWTGCGLCAYTSAVNIVAGKSYTPTDMLSLRGDWVGTEHHLDSNAGVPDGSTHEEWTEKMFDVNCYNVAREDLLSEISDPNADAIVLVRGMLKQSTGGWWYTDGHFVCAYSWDGYNLQVQDPANRDGVVTYSGGEVDGFLGTIASIVILRN